MLIGHLATYRALEQATTGLSVRELVAADFEWQPEGWATVCSYRRPGDDRGPRSLNVCLHLRDSRRPPPRPGTGHTTG